MGSLVAVLLSLLLDLPSQGGDASDLQKIVLLQSDERFELGVNGYCRINDRSGVVRPENLQRLWNKLVSEIEVTSLDSAIMKNQVREQIKITGIVGNMDPAKLTSLRLEYSNSIRKIDILNLAARHKTYPNAVDLARLYSAMLVLSQMTGICIPQANDVSQD